MKMRKVKAMIYVDYQDLKLSMLGFGAMRLPTVSRDGAQIDEAKVAEMVEYAVSRGINYFDTAWGYHDGYSETVMGNVLSQYARSGFNLASKFPGYDLANMDKVEPIFERQLKKCRVDHFDFYMFHNVCELNIDAYLDAKYGIFDYLNRQKDAGRIRHLGFSAHGSRAVMRRFLDAYGGHMEFCQIQLNYLDWSLQDARAKVDLLNEYGIPIWVMEPLRGGRLASLSSAQEKKLEALRPGETAVSWAFRFLQGIPGVKVILSGMSDMHMLRENVDIFESERPLSGAETGALFEVANDMLSENTLPCTGCRYCTAHCPKKLDIPALIDLYNEHRFTSSAGQMAFIAPMALFALPQEQRPSACIGCKNCEAVCPQNIKIAEAFRDFAARL